MDQRSPAGGWNRAQLKALGTGWPPRHGWLRNLLGRTISDETARRVEALRGKRTEKEPQPMLIETPPPETAPSEREDRVFMDRSRKTGEPWRYAVGDPERCERSLEEAGYSDDGV